ncbi:sulfurtransferase [Priestia flexa]|jgi:hypothetical protein|uniref:Sulfurtransferase n=2 Tax=Priestia TaxID=2800373 RepID=A0A0V8JMK4_9BACI|nr:MULTISPECIES: hypothetical protein [Bacillaceae]AQX54657.1 hypothetical protein BC359_10270 [Priestia flexa]KSU88275.1 hypothetical protein AS180_08995 [Priestia veravalensis]KZB90039.1 hypothetical protein A2U94_18290 [Bacillus sp. VT 712]MBN8252219.1 sulfurtransferase [Priestia flexa]MBN8435164.1 sulfurtransferase [Priestia flexa]
MSYFIGSFLVIMLGALAYKRNYPVKGVQCVNDPNELKDDRLLVDIRHYNERSESEYRNVINIPYAYLKRFYSEIPNQQIHIIAEDKIELHLGIRFLRQKGYIVSSYQLATCPCKTEKELVGCGV